VSVASAQNRSVYNHRVVSVRDAPMRDLAVRLLIRKRRLACRPCGRPFTRPGARYPEGTERFRRSPAVGLHTDRLATPARGHAKRDLLLHQPQTKGGAPRVISVSPTAAPLS